MLTDTIHTMTVEIQVHTDGSRAPPPPYLEALAYPLTECDENEADAIDSTKDCSESRSSEGSTSSLCLEEILVDIVSAVQHVERDKTERNKEIKCEENYQSETGLYEAENEENSVHIYTTVCNEKEEKEIRISPRRQVFSSEISKQSSPLHQTVLLLNSLPSGSGSTCSECSGIRRQSTSSLPVKVHFRETSPCLQERRVHSDTEDVLLRSPFKCLNQTPVICNIVPNGSPASCTSSRPYSPQPGPSGYSGSKGKGRATSTVKFDRLLGKYKHVTTSDSSDNVYSTNCSTSLNDIEDEPDNSAADRGTLYCACGILLSIITLVILLVKFA